jgi:peptidyl-prolyl cis-trans isomerase SurA
MAAGFAALVLSFSACQPKGPAGADVMAEVNGRPITAAEVEKFYQQQIQEEPQKPTGEQETMLRLNILQGMIEREILLQQAEKASLTASDAEVLNRITELKSPYTEEEFQKQLQKQGLDANTLRLQVRKDESIKKLMNKEIAARISITDAEIKAYYEENRAAFNIPETRFQLAQILVTPDPKDPARNLKNDKAKSDVEARTKIESLAGRLRNGEDFAQVAQSYSEDPNSAPNGGELGYVPISSLDKVDPALKQAVLVMQPGQVSKVIRSRQGYHLLKLISKDLAGQRQLSDPAVQQAIRQNLLGRKEQLLKAAYYDELRNQARIVNYYARRVMEAAGKK